MVVEKQAGAIAAGLCTARMGRTVLRSDWELKSLARVTRAKAAEDIGTEGGEEEVVWSGSGGGGGVYDSGVRWM